MDELALDQFCQIVTRTRRWASAAIFSGKLKTRKEGRRLLVPVSEIERFAKGEIRINQADLQPGKKKQEV